MKNQMNKLIPIFLILLAGCAGPDYEKINSVNVGRSYARGYSMHPVIQQGDELIYVYRWDSIRVGDIARRKNTDWNRDNFSTFATVHQVVGEIAPEVYRMRGVNNTSIDTEPLTPYNYGGTVVCIRRDGEIVYTRK